MAAKDWLVRYGYQLDPDGRYRRYDPVTSFRRRTQVWEPTEEGWLRFESEDGKEVPEVHSVNAAYQGTSGLSKERNPEAFDWVYSEKEIERIYKDAVEAMPKAKTV